MFSTIENPTPTTCQPFVHRDLYGCDGVRVWTWACDCAGDDLIAGMHYERLDATEEAYAHKIGEF